MSPSKKFSNLFQHTYGGRAVRDCCFWKSTNSFYDKADNLRLCLRPSCGGMWLASDRFTMRHWWLSFYPVMESLIVSRRQEEKEKWYLYQLRRIPKTDYRYLKSCMPNLMAYCKSESFSIQKPLKVMPTNDSIFFFSLAGLFLDSLHPPQANRLQPAAGWNPLQDMCPAARLVARCRNSASQSKTDRFIAQRIVNNSIDCTVSSIRMDVSNASGSSSGRDRLDRRCRRHQPGASSCVALIILIWCWFLSPFSFSWNSVSLSSADGFWLIHKRPFLL